MKMRHYFWISAALAQTVTLAVITTVAATKGWQVTLYFNKFNEGIPELLVFNFIAVYGLKIFFWDDVFNQKY